MTQDLAARVKSRLAEVPDFPKPGISFKDITPLLADAALSREVIAYFVRKAQVLQPTAVAGMESRGFMYGFALAQALGVAFVPIRKSGKLPRECIRECYALEYGEACLEIHRQDIGTHDRVLIHDDLLATGGTALAAAQLVRRCGAHLCGFQFLAELDFLRGRTDLELLAPVHNLVNY